MYDYSLQIDAFYDEKVKLSDSFKAKLFAHRDANRKRLIYRLPTLIDGISISDSSFKPQGSMAMQTIIQTRFPEEEYDIDDGLVLKKDELVDDDGDELTHENVRDKVREALKDSRFSRQPKFCTNCIRVFYADEDEERHHVDFPIYRKYLNDDDKEERELASNGGWVISDPTQVNSWFLNEVVNRNKQIDGRGTQLRRLIQLLKRFCRSRREWDLPNGMKLTMLGTECQPVFSSRIDTAFYALLGKLQIRLGNSMVIRNLADPDQPMITKTTHDQNVSDLLAKVKEALDKLQVLQLPDCNQEKAKNAWDWVFKSDGFFDDFVKNNGSSMNSGIASSAPSSPIDHRGGGRFGWTC